MKKDANLFYAVSGIGSDGNTTTYSCRVLTAAEAQEIHSLYGVIGDSAALPVPSADDKKATVSYMMSAYERVREIGERFPEVTFQSPGTGCVLETMTVVPKNKITQLIADGKLVILKPIKTAEKLAQKNLNRMKN